MRKLLPFILALLGLAGGGGIGFVMRPPSDEMVEINPCGDAETGAMAEDPDDPEAATHDYVKLNNQFVVPIVEDGNVTALVILSVSVEVVAGHTEEAYAVEPKLRDGFLQVLFDHANSGGFEGAFTTSNKMDLLRAGLLEIARKTLGPIATSVLIENIVRQDG
ncbi:MAG: flagellar basal body-associated FliL family protein [Albidovulum sp.]